MHNMDCSKRCQCFIVPNYILENLAQNEVEEARISLAKSRQMRRRRIFKEYDIDGVVALTDAGSERQGESARHVYDCKGERNSGRMRQGKKEIDQVQTLLLTLHTIIAGLCVTISRMFCTVIQLITKVLISF